MKDFREKIDKLSVVEKFKMGINGTKVYTIENGEVVIHVDALKDRLDIFDFKEDEEEFRIFKMLYCIGPYK